MKLAPTENAVSVDKDKWVNYKDIDAVRLAVFFNCM